MGHAHESNKKRIWIVLAILTMLTTVEVILGIIKPDSLHLNGVGTSWLNWIFIILTLVKAYYIAWAFMHLEGEKTWFRRSIVWSAVFLVSYLLFIILIEGNYLHETLAPLVKW
ncbi:cytochrome C oxidase subunit IV family protein [Tenacibaculum finnmarkense]|uniref:cytochrome C oxidase subunit IV family protein n=1 Tax=Tenacibaculum finnmarkense TaxID=2781243 RepID=UPI00187B2469|nr:cytochrome C oxidase subunit IV family protein [Tenacibaculum finnmarkense]MBE7633266.1 cytochrome C oxidase subunit IV [Tenacibaculum finnmarkense genomovar ulcerans]MBE7644900.1 cytochrome C oxidase subunit IV [Tenacibaculum finnmarkense genomovar ulcerans]MBE7647063.1 cytochrome C oxidase subunit IV [Tenacibaculum finnmarkense genomovar ulcerans]MBE7686839.1 cytochrome C oxidase subunit IV [Tenacibaculum finnmarkense genomovar ulcerans]MCD8399189.1 cytochrome C oxidase subunit IV family 